MPLHARCGGGAQPGEQNEVVNGNSGGGSGPLAHPGFRQYWASRITTDFGAYLTVLSLQVLVVATLEGTAVDVGLVNAARWLPYLLIGVIVGALVDRHRRRPLLIVSDLVRAALLALIPVLWLAGALNLTWLLVIVVLIGTVSLTADAASLSYLPGLVPRGSLLAAHSRLDQTEAVAQTSGPLLAGGLVSLMGAPFAVLVNAVTALVSAVSIALIRVPEPTPTPSATPHLGREIVEGLRFAYRHRTLTPLVIAGHAWFLFNAILGTAYVTLSLLVFELSAVELGLTLAAAGVGALVGSTLSARLGARFGPSAVIVSARLLQAVAWGVVLVSFAVPGAWVVAVLAAGQALFGFGMGAENANEMAFRQLLVPDAMQGRVNTSLRSLNRAMIVVGAPLGGLLADSIGVLSTIAIGIVGFTVAALALAASPFRGARYDSD